jgi:hypothetical protein
MGATKIVAHLITTCLATHLHSDETQSDLECIDSDNFVLYVVKASGNLPDDH